MVHSGDPSERLPFLHPFKRSARMIHPNCQCVQVAIQMDHSDRPLEKALSTIRSAVEYFLYLFIIFLCIASSEINKCVLLLLVLRVFVNLLLFFLSIHHLTWHDLDFWHVVFRKENQISLMLPTVCISLYFVFAFVYQFSPFRKQNVLHISAH